MSGTSYSDTIAFVAAASGSTCVKLPAHARGSLQRLVLVKTYGNITGGMLNIYDRKGACSGQLDLNVSRSGEIVSITNNTGVRVTTNAPHGLLVGDRFEFKGAALVIYPGLHNVTAVVSDTVVQTDTSFLSNPAGLWQEAPYNPTLSPLSHLVYRAVVPGDGELTEFDMARYYMNRDNQDSVNRRPTAALWLEYTPVDGSEEAGFELSVTSVAPIS
jgi:hypothetical protein